MSGNDYTPTSTSNNEQTTDQPTHIKISISKGNKQLLLQSSGSMHQHHLTNSPASDNLNPNNVSLQCAYNRMIKIKNTFMALDVMARKKDTTLTQLKWAIILNGSNTTDLTRDVTEFIEVLNQKQIRKFKRKAYKLKMKNRGCKENNVKLEKKTL